MELRQYFSILWKWLWLIALAVMVAAGSSYFASKLATPTYQTKTTLMIGQVLKNPDPNSSELYAGQQLANTYIQLAKREPVMRGVIESLGLNMNWWDLSGKINASLVQQTQLIEIYVTDSDPQRAQAIADAVAQQLIEQSPSGSSSAELRAFTQAQIDDLEAKILKAQGESKQLQQELDFANGARRIEELQGQIDILESKITAWQGTYSKLLASMEGGDVNALTIVEKAQGAWPLGPNTKTNILLAAAAGAILSIAGIFLVEYLDDTVKRGDEFARATGLISLGSIGTIEGADLSSRLVVKNEPLSPVSEDFRTLRMNILFANVDKPLKTIMLTSAGSMEGKSITIANLAVSMAEAGKRVILVDTDLRRPTLDKIFNVQKEIGLMNAILDASDVSRNIQETGIKDLSILTSGPLPPNPAQILNSEKFIEMIEQLKKQADLVLFDTPPVLMFSDPAILGTRMDGVVLVFRAGFTRSGDARRTMEELSKMHINLLGSVLTRQINGHRRGYAYYNHRFRWKNPVSGLIEKLRSLKVKYAHPPSRLLPRRDGPGSFPVKPAN